MTYLQLTLSLLKRFKSRELAGEAPKGLAIITCLSSRIGPLRTVGMKAKH